jgi:hypothetical protein
METKPGYKTTEFWLTLIASAWSMFGNVVPPPWNVVAPLVGTGLYSVARGLAKGGVLRGSVGSELAQK